MLDRLRQIVVKNFKNEAVKYSSPPLAGKYGKGRTLSSIDTWCIPPYRERDDPFLTLFLFTILMILPVPVLFLFLFVNYHNSCFPLFLTDHFPLYLLPSFSNHVYLLSSSFLYLHSISPICEGIDGLFFAGTSGRLLMKSEDRVVLYDQQARKVIAELQVR